MKCSLSVIATGIAESVHFPVNKIVLHKIRPRQMGRLVSLSRGTPWFTLYREKRIQGFGKRPQVLDAPLSPFLIQLDLRFRSLSSKHPEGQ